jgi:hypothetical protein
MGVVACNDPLNVSNQTNPDISRALSTPSGIEQLIQTGYQSAHAIFIALPTTGAIEAQANVFGLESYGSVANFGMNTRGGIPRIQVQNERGNATADGNYKDFRDFAKLSRSMANGIQALDKLVAAGNTLGSVGRNARARAFAFFVMGVAQGSTALIYDSVAVLDHTTAPDNVPPLVGYNVAMSKAQENLDSALATANSADAQTNGGTDFQMSNWINGITQSRAQFIQMVRSFKAKYRAGVARNPTERAAVDWAAVIADATNGITADLNITLSNSAGWPQTYVNQMYTYSGWHMMPVPIIGFADSTWSGSEYDAWLAQPSLAARNNSGSTFLMIRTLDRRFPSGDTRAAQTAASGCTASNTNAACKPTVVSGSATLGLPYFRNRLGGGDDTKGDPWAQSQYDHYRFRYLTLNNTNRDGPWPMMTRAESEMLAAEGYIRTGNYAAAATLIDRTRLAQGGLPSVAGLTGGAPTASAYDPWAGTPVPGGSACVPRVPKNGAAGRQCGNLFEALKWEKRLETLFTGYVQWYVDNRGWGDQAEGTAISWPVPYQELDARYPGNTNFYYLGGSVGNGGAPKGNYGW